MQRTLFHSKFSSYWKFTIESSSGNSKVLWSRLRCLLQPPSVDSTAEHTAADEFAKFFVNKIDRIRLSTSTAPKPTIERRGVAELLKTFRPITPNEIMTLLRQSPVKQSSLDPIPTWLLKRVGGVLAPSIAVMCNADALIIIAVHCT